MLETTDWGDGVAVLNSSSVEIGEFGGIYCTRNGRNSEKIKSATICRKGRQRFQSNHGVHYMTYLIGRLQYLLKAKNLL